MRKLALAFAATAVLTACGSSAPPLQGSFQQVVRENLAKIVEIQWPDGSLGSGVVFDDKGDIVTNAHVFGTSAAFEVTQTAGAAARQAGRRLPGSGPCRHPGHQGRRRSAAGHVGGLTKAQVGEWVLAMGTPFGFADTVTQGIVSATNRSVQESAAKPVIVITRAIQTSADVNPGNSCGGLVNLNGDVLGLPTLDLVDPQLGAIPGIGFAIPSNTVVSVARRLIGHPGA